MTVPAPLVVSTGFGLTMATATAVDAHGVVLAGAAATALMVLVGMVFRPAATGAVACAVVVIALGDAAPMTVAVSGFCAAAYLVVRHAAGVTAATLVAAVGFSFVGLVATVFPLQVRWLPVLAPLAGFGCYLVATQPFLGDWAGVKPTRPR